MSKDPIGLFSGEFGFYNYVGDSNFWVDVLGLSTYRGRIQAQGDKLEESVSWNQDNPPTVSDGLKMIDQLEAKLSKSDRKLRAKEFQKARQFVKNAGNSGGVDAPVSKTFQVQGTKHERVDIEVITSKAFVPDPPTP